MGGRDEGGQSYYVISIKRQLKDWRLRNYEFSCRANEKLRDVDREEAQQRGGTVFLRPDEMIHR